MIHHSRGTQGTFLPFEELVKMKKEELELNLKWMHNSEDMLLQKEEMDHLKNRIAVLNRELEQEKKKVSQAIAIADAVVDDEPGQSSLEGTIDGIPVKISGCVKRAASAGGPGPCYICKAMMNQKTTENILNQGVFCPFSGQHNKGHI